MRRLSLYARVNFDVLQDSVKILILLTKLHQGQNCKFFTTKKFVCHPVSSESIALANHLPREIDRLVVVCI